MLIPVIKRTPLNFTALLWFMILGALISHGARSGPSNFGTTGLIGTPTAFMAQDAILTPSFSTSGKYEYYNLTYQAFPWLEAAFRYRKVFDVENSPWTDYYDRNFAAKLRLLEEDFYLPQVAIGMRDFVGTGLVGSEYLVASKHLGRLELSLGIGWGDFAGDDNLKNPLIYLSDKFRDRQDGTEGGNRAGTIPTGSAFQGEHVGWFAGISYQLPHLPVRLLAERNPEYNRFDTAEFLVDKPKNNLSFGFEWDITPEVTLGAASQQGDDWSVKLAYQTNTNNLIPKRSIKFRSVTTLLSNSYSDNWYANLLRDMENSGLLLLDGSLTGDEETAQLRIGNLQFRDWNHAIELATNLADLHLPDTVKNIEFTLEDGGYVIKNVHIPRPTHKVLVEDLDSIRIYPAIKPTQVYKIPDYATNFVQETIAFDVGLATRIQIFDPDDPFRYGVGIGVGTTIALPRDWVLRGYYTQLLEHNFDESRRTSNSVLPHVRTDVVDYLNDTSRLQALYIERRSSTRNEVHWRHYAGVLEEMFMGLGGEVVYKPYNSRVGYGASYAWVTQRASDSDFGTRNYDVFTGFVSVYWDSPIYNYDIALHVGQYLAEDKGATLEINRTFKNGWQIGAWATLTDVSSEDFGEGSFDKGISLKIPFGAGRHSSSLLIRPVQRDGGQRLIQARDSNWQITNQAH